MNNDLYSELYEDSLAVISDLNEQLSVLLNDLSLLKEENKYLKNLVDDMRYGE